MTERKQINDLTGLTMPTQGTQHVKYPKVQETLENQKEYNLVTQVLGAADFRNDEEMVEAVEIKRRNEYRFTVHLRPISDQELRTAMKKATKMIPNPNNPKMPKVEGDFDNCAFSSWLIYLSTTEEDQKNIWGNPAIMRELEALQPVDTIDKILTLGEKDRMVDVAIELSSMNVREDEVISEEDYSKN